MVRRREQKNNCYTASLSSELPNTVFAIKAWHGTEFRTRSFSPAPGQAHGERWWAASVQEENGFWRVHEYEVVPDIYGDEDGRLALSDTGTVVKKTPKLNGWYVCFFDALHACAEFEVAARGMGLKPTGETKEELGDNHYRAFAKREKIPFDKKTNLPVPVANGQLLVSGGVFDPEDLARAETLTDNLDKDLVPPEGMALVPLKQDDIMKGFNKSIDNRKILSDLEKQVVALRDSFNYAVEKDFVFKTGVPGGAYFNAGAASWCAFFCAVGIANASPVGIVLQGGVLALHSMLLRGRYKDAVKEGNHWFPRRQFKNDLKIFRKQTAKLPEGDFKEAATQLAIEAELRFHQLWVRHSYREAMEEGTGKQKRQLKKAVKAFNQVAEERGVLQSRVTKMLQEAEGDWEETSIDMKHQNAIGQGAAKLEKAIGRLKSTDTPKRLAP